MSLDTSIQSTEQSLTNFEKNVYNTFLATSKRVKNQPYKLRENFSNLEKEKYILLKKLSNFFTRYDHIQLGDFFIAPYEVYSKTEYFDLSFYITRKALSCYTQYIRSKELVNPSSEASMVEGKNILKFIYKFCITNKLTLEQYKQHTVTPLFLIHLKEHRINFLTLHALDVDHVIRSYEKDFLDFYFPDFYKYYKETRNGFISSTNYKNLMRQGLEIISKKLLTSHQN